MNIPKLREKRHFLMLGLPKVRHIEMQAEKCKGRRQMSLRKLSNDYKCHALKHKLVLHNYVLVFIIISTEIYASPLFYFHREHTHKFHTQQSHNEDTYMHIYTLFFILESILQVHFATNSLCMPELNRLDSQFQFW